MCDFDPCPKCGEMVRLVMHDCSGDQKRKDKSGDAVHEITVDSLQKIMGGPDYDEAEAKAVFEMVMRGMIAGTPMNEWPQLRGAVRWALNHLFDKSGGASNAKVEYHSERFETASEDAGRGAVTCPECEGERSIHIPQCDKCGRHWSVRLVPKGANQ